MYIYLVKVKVTFFQKFLRPCGRCCNGAQRVVAFHSWSSVFVASVASTKGRLWKVPCGRKHCISRSHMQRTVAGQIQLRSVAEIHPFLFCSVTWRIFELPQMLSCPNFSLSNLSFVYHVNCVMCVLFHKGPDFRPPVFDPPILWNKYHKQKAWSEAMMP